MNHDSEQINHKVGYKHTKLGWIPEEWNIYSLKEIAEIDKRSLGTNTPADYEFNYVSLSDVDSQASDIETTKQIFATAPSRARRIVSKGDVLLATVRPNLQNFTIIKDEVKDLIASTGFAVVTLDRSDNEFFYHYLFCPAATRQFHRLIAGSNYPAITSSDVRNLKIILPKKSWERQKISRILGTWDEAIEKTQQLITLKEQRKKGLMQQLLTGKKRLPGFSGEWKEVKLSELLKPTSRPVPKPKESYLALGIRSHGKGTFLKPDSEPDKIMMDTLYQVSKDELIINITFAWEGAIAILKEEDHGALVSHRFPTYQINSNKGAVEFLKYFILQPRFKYFLELISPGGAGRNRVLNKKDFIKLAFKFPEKEEQLAIGKVLESATEEIQLLQKKLHQLQQQKKGLMQKLLTGQVRVKVAAAAQS